jgi:hypothetical protein
MRLRVVITPTAKVNLVTAAEWYEEREPDSLLPLELFAEFDSVVDLIAENPQAFPRYRSRAQRCARRSSVLRSCRAARGRGRDGRRLGLAHRL